MNDIEEEKAGDDNQSQLQSQPITDMNAEQVMNSFKTGLSSLFSYTKTKVEQMQSDDGRQ